MKYVLVLLMVMGINYGDGAALNTKPIASNENWTIKVIPANNHMTEVLLSTSAYLIKRGRNGKDAYIVEDGLHNWQSEETIISVYFYAKTGVKFDLYIKYKVYGESKIQVTLDDTSYVVSLKGANLHYHLVDSFEVKSSGYHKIDLKGVKKSGQYFGDVSSLIFGESSDQASIVGIAKSVDRGTPSIHLWYDTPYKVNIEYYYNEVSVVKDYDLVGTYIMAVGFNGGYFGIQVKYKTERRIIFSIWSPQDTHNSNEITDDNQVKLIRQGENVYIGDFGNEGSGKQSIIKYQWKPETTYKFLVRGVPDPNEKKHTIYTAWFAGSDGIWQLIASYSRPKSGKYLNGYYSFLEDFNHDYTYMSRKARYCNQWACDTNGTWHELTGAKFTGIESAKKKVRLDFDAGVESYQGQECFYMINGGFFEGKTPLNSHLVRKANNAFPKIDFKSLP